uniref:N/A n=1 Tax=Ganoderma boninense TaxID=34458 RepID=A0A5K1K0E0_9APHY|nr:N/A [Ganoderma boninense]
MALPDLTCAIKPMVMPESVAIFWDYENCALPALEPPYTIVNKVRRLAHQYGSVKTFKAYLECPEQLSVKSMALRSELQSCGVSLIDCPHNGRKDVADKMIMVDMMAHAIDNPAPTTIMLISGDRDFIYAVSILSLRQYRIVLLAPRAAHGGLKAQASAVYHWPDDFLPEIPPSVQQWHTFQVNSSGNGRPQNALKAGQLVFDRHWSSASTSPSTSPAHSEAAFEPSVDGDTLGSPDDCVESGTPARRVLGTCTSSAGDISVLEHLQEPDGKFESAGGNADCQEPTTASPSSTSHSLSLSERKSSASLKSKSSSDKSTAPPPPSWATLAKHEYTRWGPFAQNQPSPVTSDALGFETKAIRTTLSSSPPGLNVNASSFKPIPRPIASFGTDEGGSGGDDGAGWQTYSRAVKKPPPQLPSEFKPLVKVLKRQLVEGVVQLESSLLGQLLSQEVTRLSLIYERAGVARLKEYTALAAERGIVTTTRESADGHNYIALHPAYRRKAAVAAV